MVRKKAALSLIDSDGSGTDDSISTTSTVPSDVNEEYMVSCVLAEKERNGKILYLVAWDGYPVERSTWEPRQNFQDPEAILGQWNETKERIAKGFDEPFDLDDWKRKKKVFDEAARKRKERRRRKRLRKQRKKGSARLEGGQEKEAHGAPASQHPSAKRKSLEAEQEETLPAPVQPKHQKQQLVHNEDSKLGASHGSEDSLMDELRLKTAKLASKQSATSASSTDVTTQSNHSATTPKAVPVSSNAPTARELVKKVVDQSRSESEVPKGSNQPVENAKAGPARGPLTSAIPAAAGKTIVDEPGNTRIWRNNTAMAQQTQTSVTTNTTKDPIAATQRSNTSESDHLKNSDDITPIDPSTDTVASAPKRKGITEVPTFHPTPNPGRDGSNVKISLTCPYFDRKAACGRIPCPFLHKPSDETASFELYEQWVESTSSTQPWPKFQDPAQVCPFWFSGGKGCKHTTEMCWFAHWQVAGGVERVPTKHQTCAFWARGNCFKSENKCLYAHQYLDQVGPIPKRPKTEQGNETPTSSISMPRPATSRTVAVSSLHPALPGVSGEHLDRAFLNPENRTPKGLRAILSVPDALLSHCGTLEVEIIEAEEELKDLITKETKSTLKLPVNGTAPSWVVSALQKLSDLSFHATLTFANEAVKEKIQRFLTEKECAAIIELSSALVFLFPGDRFGLFFMKVEPETAANRKTSHGVSTLFTRQIDKLFDIRSDQFFELASADGQDNGSMCKRSVCLMFNQEETPEREMWVTYFRNIGATVFQLQMPGAWKLFCMDNCGAIIAHPAFVTFNKVPDFGKQLMAPHNIYQLGRNQAAFECDGGVGEAPFEAIQIFPYGTTVLVTDETFEKHPRDALRILQHIYNQNKPYPSFVWKWKLAGRYGLKNWLLDVAVDHREEFDTGNKSRLDLVHALENLCPYEFEDPEDPPHPIPDAPLVAMPDWMMEDYAKVWRSDPESALARIIDWFGYWSLTQREFCRRFVVVHPTEVPKWKTTNQHLIFYTPERYFVKFGS